MTVEQSRSPLFEGISPESRAAMKACFDVREQRFRADEEVFHVGLRGHGDICRTPCPI